MLARTPWTAVLTPFLLPQTKLTPKPALFRVSLVPVAHPATAPSAERPSYAAVHVEVLEHTDGRLQIRYQDEIIPCRQAPPRPGVLRAPHGAMAPPPALNRVVKLLGNHRLSQHQLRQLANLEPALVNDQVANDDPVQSVGSSPETALPPRLELPPRQLALWKAVQHARVQGLALREIARQFGVSRNTVRTYARALTQPTSHPRNHGSRPLSQLITKRSD